MLDDERVNGEIFFFDVVKSIFVGIVVFIDKMFFIVQLCFFFLIVVYLNILDREINDQIENFVIVYDFSLCEIFQFYE